jgi:hypothetical protein
MTRRSCSSRGAGSALRSTESKTRSKCWRSPNTICEVRTAFPFAAFRTKSDLLILPSPRVSQRRSSPQDGSGSIFDFEIVPIKTLFGRDEAAVAGSLKLPRAKFVQSP